MFRKGYKDTQRDRALATMNNVLYHLHPTKVKRHGLKLTYTFCLGGLSFFLFILLTITGIYLMFFYRPAAELGVRRQAYQDMQAIRTSVFFGDLVRNIHRWGAAPHGAHRDAAHGAGVLHGRVQAAAGVQLGGRRHPAVPDPRPVVHRLPAAVGPAVDLGRHGRRRTWPGTRRSSPTRSKFILLGGVRGRARTRSYAGTCCTCLALPFVLVIFLAVHFWRIRKDGGISGPL